MTMKNPRPVAGANTSLTFSLSQDSLAELFEREGLSATEGLPVVRFEGAEKLSAQLLDFAHPLVGHLHHTGDEEAREGLLKFAVLAWNAAVSEKAVTAVTAGIAAKRGDTAREPGDSIPTFEWLIQRRRGLFRDDRRLIGAVHFERLPHDHHVSVLGAFFPSHKAKQPAPLPMPEPGPRRTLASADLPWILAPLYTWGDPSEICGCEDHDWAQGFGPADVPALVALAWKWGEPGRWDEDLWDEEFWAPFHAWRVLRCLKAPEGVWPMLGRLDDLAAAGEDDHCEEFLQLCTEVGMPSVAPLAAYLADPARSPEARSLVAEALGQIGSEHPACRPDCLAAAMGELAEYQANAPALNGSLVDALARLEAAEAEPLVAEAFAAGRVEIGQCGPEENVIRWLRGEGLRWARRDSRSPTSGRKPRKPNPSPKEKARAKRKREKAARRKGGMRRR